MRQTWWSDDADCAAMTASAWCGPGKPPSQLQLWARQAVVTPWAAASRSKLAKPCAIGCFARCASNPSFCRFTIPGRIIKSDRSISGSGWSMILPPDSPRLPVCRTPSSCPCYLARSMAQNHPLAYRRQGVSPALSAPITRSPWRNPCNPAAPWGVLWSDQTAPPSDIRRGHARR